MCVVRCVLLVVCCWFCVVDTGCVLHVACCSVIAKGVLVRSSVLLSVVVRCCVLIGVY